jgi:phosphoribosyl-ATP pyrophosphohydrolase
MNRTISKTNKHLRDSYTVSMYVDFYKEMRVCAGSMEEAKELAEARVRSRQTSLYSSGYSLGDVEIIGVEEIDQ